MREYNKKEIVFTDGGTNCKIKWQPKQGSFKRMLEEYIKNPIAFNKRKKPSIRRK